MDFFIRHNEESQPEGPHSESQVREMLSSGSLPDTTMYWHEGMVDWQPVKALTGGIRIVLDPPVNHDQTNPPPPPPLDSANTEKWLTLAGLGVGGMVALGLLIWVVLWLFGGINPLYPIKQGDQWGYIDSSGKIVINPQFDSALIMLDDLAPAAMDEKWGFIDRDGKWVINAQFEDAGFFKEGLAPVALDDKWGYVNDSGKMAINYQFDRASLFHNGMARVKMGDKYGFIDTDGKYLINPQYDDAEDLGAAALFLDVGELIPVRQDDKWGYIDEEGTIVINLQFDRAQPFVDGIAAVKLGDKYGYIGTDGKYIVNPQFEDARPFIGSLAAVASDDDKWGYIDRVGKFVINPQFKGVQPFMFGELTRVTIDDDYRVAYINKEGKIVWTEPESKKDNEEFDK